MSKYVEDDQLLEYKINKERKYNKGENSKISKILKKLDDLETLMLKLIKAFHIPKEPIGLNAEEISFVGDSSDEDDHPFLSRNY